MIKGDFFIDNRVIINLSVFNIKGELVDKIYSDEIFHSELIIIYGMLKKCQMAFTF